MSDLLYCRVLTGNKDMEPELVCIDSNGKASGLGVLKDGFMFKVNLEISRRLLSGSNQFLRSLAKHLPPFEITIGQNGRIWIKCETAKQTIYLYEIILNYSNVNSEDTDSFVDNLVKSNKFLE
jgi:exosome complex component RRP40